MKGSFYTLCYAAVLGGVCALLLTATSNFTGPYKQANAKAEEVLNILSVLGVPFDVDASGERLVEVFNANVREKSQGYMKLYFYRPSGGKAEVVAVEFSGAGLWGPVKGLLSLESDMKTIRGVTFYEHEETPGLGGEISSDWFQGQFVGKTVVDDAGKAGIFIKRGADKSASNEVDAITGATMTCDKIETMLNKTVARIVKGRVENGQ